MESAKPAPGRRKPAALRRLEGNPSKRPIPPEIHAEPGSPVPPSAMRGEARAEWDRIVPQLLELGLLARIDRVALVGYCEAWAETRMCQSKINDEGVTFVAVTGQHKINPMVRVRNDAWARALRFLAEFGLTPAARSRVTAAKPPEDPKGAAEYFQ